MGKKNNPSFDSKINQIEEIEFLSGVDFDGANGNPGAPGAPASMAFLTNENVTIAANANGDIAKKKKASTEALALFVTCRNTISCRLPNVVWRANIKKLFNELNSRSVNNYLCGTLHNGRGCISDIYNRICT